MHTFYQQVCGDNGLLAEMVYHSSIVTYSHQGRNILKLYVFGKMVNQPKLT
jgi:hypothetical protein